MQQSIVFPLSLRSCKGLHWKWKMTRHTLDSRVERLNQMFYESLELAQSVVQLSMQHSFATIDIIFTSYSKSCQQAACLQFNILHYGVSWKKYQLHITASSLSKDQGSHADNSVPATLYQGQTAPYIFQKGSL